METTRCVGQFGGTKFGKTLGELLGKLLVFLLCSLSALACGSPTVANGFFCGDKPCWVPQQEHQATAPNSTTGIGWNQDNKIYRPASAHEGPLEAFLRPSTFESHQVFAQDRFPNVVVAMDGTVIAGWNGVQCRRSVDGGATWGEPIPIATGLMGGSFVVDEISGDVLAFVEEEHPPGKPVRLYRSRDHGATWANQELTIHPNSLGHVPALHMNDHGITLRHGRFKGRLVCPSRWYGRTNYPVEFFHTHYTNAIFSDDGGRTWKASEPFPAMGTGEACLAELADGRLYYNTRRHWAPTTEDALWRWTGVSLDAGQTWENPLRSLVLPDGNSDSTYGLMGGLVRLPILGRDVLVFSNVVSQQGRKNGYVWCSFDGGATWPVRRQVFAGQFAYSSLNAGRPGTPSEGWIYLLNEGGPQGGGTFSRFNLSWLLEGEATGNAAVPDWVFNLTPQETGDSGRVIRDLEPPTRRAALQRNSNASPDSNESVANPETSHADSRITRVIVRREGDDNSKSYRIPGIAVTPKGTIVACFDIRWNGAGDLPGNIDVGVMRSTDNGDTWGPMVVAMDYDQHIPDSAGNGVGDPAILVDRHTGHLFIAALWSFGNNAWHGSKPGMDPNETGQWVIARSTDDGLTWERPRSITPQIKDPSWRLLFNGPGAGIQLVDGTLVFPAQYKDATAKPSSCFIYSSDQGENWKISPAAIPGTPLTSESQIVQLSDGSLLMTMRNETRDPQRAWSRWAWTGDLTNGRWVDTRLDVTDPVCMAGLTRHPSGLLLLSNNNSNRRERMTIRYSRDEGQTWSAGRLLDPRPSAYSCLATLANGEIGILYECGDGHSVETLTFARFPLEWIIE